MRFLFGPLLLLCLLGCSAQQEAPSGHWSGTAQHQGRREHVELTIDEGGRSGLLRIDEERVLRRIVIRPDGPRFSFNIATDNPIQVSGETVGDEIRMVAQSGPVRVPFRLQRSPPPPPPPYGEEELHFSGGGPRLNASLLSPAGKGPHPAIILIHGSSTPSREDFRFYADAFARCGVATLIYDKRPVVGPDGVTRASLAELAADARAGADRLRSDPRIDPRRVGYWGHSQGGWVAPIAAAADPRAAFVISFSGPVASFAEVNRYADLQRLKQRGFSAGEIGAAGDAIDRLDDYVRRGGDEARFQGFLQTARRQPWAPFTSLTSGPPTQEDRRTWLRWRDQDIDAAGYWKRLHIPVLALFGAQDDVVPVQFSVQRLQAAVKEAGNSGATIRIFNAGHGIERQPEFMPNMLRWLRTEMHLPRRTDCP